MNPPTTLTNHNPPATIGCGLNPNPIRREESDTPHDTMQKSRMGLCVEPDGRMLLSSVERLRSTRCVVSSKMWEL